MKAQSAILDGMFFMLVCGTAATLLFYTSGLYGASTSRQIATVYNYEYAGTTLVSLHYAKDTDNKWFWIQLKDELDSADPKSKVQSYLRLEADNVWDAIQDSSPSQKPVLYFIGPTSFYCHGDPIVCGSAPAGADTSVVFASSVKTIDKLEREWEVVLQLYY